ncbi:response regulator receiver domain-containing protein [Epilithonimonas arachidiradicis]|nr:response regulator receiver domain-containing protein [Epilithonimonas arachidiradicis]
MVCDDDQGILDVVELMLEIEGYRVIKVLDSTTLEEQLISNRPDLLLLDLWMPIVSGEHILKSVRSSSTLGDLPVIIFSASIDGASIADNAGANAFLSKPFDMIQLTSVIEKVITQSKA